MIARFCLQNYYIFLEYANCKAKILDFGLIDDVWQRILALDVGQHEGEHPLVEPHSLSSDVGQLDEHFVPPASKLYYNGLSGRQVLVLQRCLVVNTFKTGKCPTCGHDIEESVVNEHKDKMYEYGDLYKKEEAQEMEIMKELQTKQVEHANALEVYTTKIAEIKDKIHNIDAEVAKYNNAVKLISENYDTLIKEHQEQADKIKADIDKKDIDVGEWTDMGELFSKTLRYNLLDTLIPHINRSIQYFINKLDQSYKIEYDQEFKPHIFVESFDKEIAYNNLSTGQRKSLDIAIIFGVLQNVISSVNFNVFVLDELFSNMDTDTRNIMLELLQETMDADKSIFVINHAEMNDDYFKHKIRVRLEPKTITTKKAGTISVKCSHYEQIF